ARSLAVVRVQGCARCSYETFRDVDMTAAQPLAQPLGLRVEPRLIRDALPEDAVDDEVDGPQVGQYMAGDRQLAGLGEQFAELVHQVCVRKPAPMDIGAHPDPDVRGATLV